MPAARPKWTRTLAALTMAWPIALFIIHAAANGRFPQASALLVAPDAPRFLAVRSTFGLLFSRAAGDTWDWVCERAVGYSGIQDPTLGLMLGGTMIAGLDEGLARSADSGCSWDFAHPDLAGAPVVDLTVRKDLPSSALALVWDTNAGSHPARFFSSSDNGASFSPYGRPIDPSVLVLTLDVAPSAQYHAPTTV